MVTLAVLGCGLAAMCFVWAQRSVVTGRLVHWACGKRSWILIAATNVYGLVQFIVVNIYEAQRVGLLGEAAKSSQGYCQAMLIVSHASIALYMMPYLIRATRVAVLYEPRLKAYCRCVLSQRCGMCNTMSTHEPLPNTHSTSPPSQKSCDSIAGDGCICCHGWIGVSDLAPAVLFRESTQHATQQPPP